MPAIGDAVLVMSEGNHAPYAWVGRVASMNGTRDWVLSEAALIPHCGQGNTGPDWPETRKTCGPG